MLCYSDAKSRGRAACERFPALVLLHRTVKHPSQGASPGGSLLAEEGWGHQLCLGRAAIPDVRPVTPRALP